MKKFFSFVKIEHTLFSLPMIYAGMALGLDANRADGLVLSPGMIIQKALLILGAATGARTVGFAVNRIVDRRIDAKNPRTAGRELPSGKMTMGQALAILAVALIVLESCAAALNPRLAGRCSLGAGKVASILRSHDQTRAGRSKTLRRLSVLVGVLTPILTAQCQEQ